MGKSDFISLTQILEKTQIEDELEEEVLCVDKNKVEGFFKEDTVINAEAAKSLITVFSSSGEYIARESVESDLTKVQAFPVVVIKNRKGQVLQLKRKEKDTKNTLHEKLVIWAGGHVRKEDSANGGALLNCASRELQEELRLRVTQGTCEPAWTVTAVTRLWRSGRYRLSKNCLKMKRLKRLSNQVLFNRKQFNG